MVCACIDIGTNTTRVLVADARRGRLTEVLQRRAFTALGMSPKLAKAQIAEVARVVSEQREVAERAGARHVSAVATAALRRAENRDELCDAVRELAGLDIAVLGGLDEARLAFLGATQHAARAALRPRRRGRRRRRLDRDRDRDARPRRRLVGQRAGRLRGPRGRLRRRPAGAARARHRARARGRRVRRPQPALARVGGRRRRQRRVAAAAGRPRAHRRGARPRDGAAVRRSRRPGRERSNLAAERVRLLPAGILVLEAAARRLGKPLQIGRGGLREGVLLELAATHEA